MLDILQIPWDKPNNTLPSEVKCIECGCILQSDFNSSLIGNLRKSVEFGDWVITEVRNCPGCGELEHVYRKVAGVMDSNEQIYIE